MDTTSAQKRLCDPAIAGTRIYCGRRCWTRFHRDNEGTGAIEFALVAVPFFSFIFSLLGVANYFFIATSLDRGMDDASRLIRTGAAYSVSSPILTVGAFKSKVCQSAGGWITCGNVQVFVQKFPDWASVAPQACLTAGGSATSSSDAALLATNAGTASEIVIVTTCYKWALAARIPFISLGNMSDGSLMMQTSTAFRSEPYAAAS